jgi:hypothetical protein
VAHSTLSALSTPEFPQVFASTIDRQIEWVDRIAVQSHLVQCYFSDEWCDCRKPATVHHLKSEQEFCLTHFLEVEGA